MAARRWKTIKEKIIRKGIIAIPAMVRLVVGYPRAVVSRVKFRPAGSTERRLKVARRIRSGALRTSWISGIILHISLDPQ